MNRDGPAWISRPDVQAGRIVQTGQGGTLTRKAFDPRDGPGTLLHRPQADDIVALSLVGEFDLANAASIGTEAEGLLRAGNHLILDLSEATFVDSWAMAALSSVAKRAMTIRRVAVLQLGTAAIVETMVELSQLERVLARADTRADALRAIRQLEADLK